MLKQIWQHSEELAAFVKYVKKKAQHPHAALNSRANLCSYTSAALTVSQHLTERQGSVSTNGDRHPCCGMTCKPWKVTC